MTPDCVLCFSPVLYVLFTNGKPPMLITVILSFADVPTFAPATEVVIEERQRLNSSYWSYIVPKSVRMLILVQVRFVKFVSATPALFVAPAVKSAVRKTRLAFCEVDIIKRLLKRERKEESLKVCYALY